MKKILSVIVFLLLIISNKSLVQAGIEPIPAGNKTATSATITAGAVTGNIFSCAGVASANPDIQQLAVSGSGLTANITATAPANFQVSLAANSGYGSSVTLTESGGKVTGVVVYVRSAATASGHISGSVALASAGATSVNVAVTGTINALPTANAVPNQTVQNGTNSTAVNFAGKANTYNWVNNTPSIGLGAGGTGNIPPFTATNTGNNPVTATVTVTPAYTGLAYVVNTLANTVTVINTLTNVTAATINVGNAPVAAGISADGSRVYVTNKTDGTVSVADGASNMVIATVKVGTQPEGVAVSPDGSRVFVTNTGSGNVSVINTSTNTVVSTITVGTSPDGIAVSPDGGKVYVANNGANNVSVINTSSNAVVATIPVGTAPNGITVSPNGSTVYVANTSDGNVSVINAGTNTVAASISTDTGPQGVAVSPDGSRLYVANSGANDVSVINTVSNAVLATVTVYSGPLGIAVTPDGSTVYVEDFDAGSVQLISTATNTVSGLINMQYFSGSLGNFINSGAGCTGTPVKFTIKVNPPPPVLPVITATGTLTALSTTKGTASAATSFSVSGVNMQGGILVSAPAGFEISSDGLSFSKTLTTGAAGNIEPTTIYLRLAAATAAGSYSGNVVMSSPGAPNVNMATVSSTVTAPAPGITAGTVNNIISACLGTASVSPHVLSFTVVGSGLTANIVATAPTNFEVSLSMGSGFGSSVTLPESGGIVNSTAVYVRSSAMAPVGNISGNVTLSSTGSASKTIAVKGVIKALPTVTAPTNQTVVNGAAITAINFAGTGNAYNWVNNNPGIGLAASGTGNIASFNAINTGTAAVTATITATPVNRGLAYIPLVYDSSVEIINTSTSLAAGTIFGSNGFVFSDPFAAAVSPNGNWLYVTDIAQSCVFVINTTTQMVTAAVFTGGNPENVAVSRDGTRVYVSNLTSNTVTAINATTNTAIARDTVGSSPSGLAVSADGSKVYVSNSGSNTVSVINTATNTITATITVGSAPSGEWISPDGTRLYASNTNSGTVSVINTATNAVVATITVGSGPRGLTVSPDGTKVYVANSASNTVSVINTATNTVIATIPVAAGPYGVSETSDGSEVYAGSSVINTTTNTVIANLSANAAIGSFINPDTGCPGAPVSFTMTVDPTPLTIAATGTLSALSTTPGTASASTSFSVTGANMKAGILVTPPAGFEVSTDNSTFSKTVTLGAARNIAATAVYVRLAAATAAGTYSGSVTLSSTGATSVKVPAAGSIVATTPTIVNSDASGAISACAGSASANPDIQQFTVSGTGLTANITATAPANFQVSLAAGSGYGSTVTLAQSGGKVNSATVFVRSAATASGHISGNVTLASTGATSKTAGVKGYVDATPTVNAVANQTVLNGAATTAINFSGSANTFNWVNTTPGIGLPASGMGSIASFNAVNTGSSPVTATITATPVAAGLAYIPNDAGGNVSVINTATSAVVATIDLQNPGSNPNGVAVKPDGSRVYVSNAVSNSISVINTTTNSVIANIPVATGTGGLAVSPDGSKLYVANPGTSFEPSSTLTVISTATNAIINTIIVGRQPIGVGVSQDGTRVYVSNYLDGTVSAINTATNTVIATITVGTYPNNLSVSPSGGRVYVSNYGSGNVSVINTATEAVVATIRVSIEPEGITVSPDGNRVYVASQGNEAGLANGVSFVSVINTITNAVIAAIPVGNGAYGVSLTPDGSRLYVVNEHSDNVSVINTATNTVLTTVNVGSLPVSIGSFINGGLGCSGNAITFTITVNPTPATPNVTAAGSLTALTTKEGTASASSSFTVSGTKMTAGILVTPPAGFEVSTDNNTFSHTVTAGAAGTIMAVSVYVRLAAATAPGAYAGNIVLSSTGTTSVNFATVSSTVTALPQGIAAGPASGIIYTCAGAASVSPHIQQIVVSGNGLTASITATAPASFEVSLAASSGYGSSVTIPQSGGRVNSAVIYVRSAASASGNISGAVTLASAGSTSKSISVSGAVNALPAVNAVSNQTVLNGSSTTAVTFTGTGAFGWVNNTPSIGLAASGTGNIASFKAVNTGSSPVTATVKVTPVTPAFAYIADGYADSVSVIDVANNAAKAKIPVGIEPAGVAISPDGSRVYVVNEGSSSVSVINTATNKVIATVGVGSSPIGVAVTPDGSRVYVGNYFDGTVSVINATTNTLITTIGIGRSVYINGVAANPDGSRIYVANSTGNVSVISTATNLVIASIQVGSNPSGIVVSPDGSRLYVANGYSFDVSVVNTATNTVTAAIVLGTLPDGIAISPDGSRVYVTNPNSNNISVINTATNAVVATVTTGSEPIGASVSPDGSKVYVTNTESNNVSVINTATNKVSATITVGSGPDSYGSFISGGSGCSGAPVSFTITVNPATLSNNANLSALKISAGTLTPAFAAGTSSYTASVANTITSITLTPTSSDANATIKVNGATIASGATTAAITLAAGANTITTLVTAQNGTTTKTYTLTVTRASGGADSYVPIAIGTGISVTKSTETLTLAEDGIQVHQGVSPNGDGINDFLQIDNISQYPNNKLSIMNRNGQLIYETQGYDNSSKVFDGHSNKNGQMQVPGTYFYQLDYTVNGIIKHKTGFLVLKY